MRLDHRHESHVHAITRNIGITHGVARSLLPGTWLGDETIDMCCEALQVTVKPSNPEKGETDPLASAICDGIPQQD